MRDPRDFLRLHDTYDPGDIDLHEQGDGEQFEQSLPPGAHPSDRTNPQASVIPLCPKCQSSRVDVRHRARKTAGLIGAIAGAVSGAAIALSGAETGAAVGMLAGPVGAVCGAIAGAVITGLIGGTAGCATGSVFGEIVDDKIFDNCRCHACGHTFSRPKAST